MPAGCPRCGEPPGATRVAIQSWEDKGVTFTMKRKFLVRSIESPPLCDPCATWLTVRRLLAGALLWAPLGLFIIGAFITPKAGIFGAMAGAMYAIYIVRNNGYAWADTMMYGSELEEVLDPHIPRGGGPEATIAFPIGILHWLVRGVIGVVVVILILFVSLGVGVSGGGKGGESLIEAAGKGSLDGMKAAIKAGANVNAKTNFSGETALHVACSARNAEAVEFLLGAKADVKATDRHQRTPLHSAAASMSPLRDEKGRVAELLIAAGADVNAKDEDGRTPCDLARSGDDIEKVIRARGGRPGR